MATAMAAAMGMGTDMGVTGLTPQSLLVIITTIPITIIEAAVKKAIIATKFDVFRISDYLESNKD